MARGIMDKKELKKTLIDLPGKVHKGKVKCKTLVSFYCDVFCLICYHYLS